MRDDNIISSMFKKNLLSPEALQLLALSPAAFHGPHDKILGQLQILKAGPSCRCIGPFSIDFKESRKCITPFDSISILAAHFDINSVLPHRSISLPSKVCQIADFHSSTSLVQIYLHRKISPWKVFSTSFLTRSALPLHTYLNLANITIGANPLPDGIA